MKMDLGSAARIIPVTALILGLGAAVRLRETAAEPVVSKDPEQGRAQNRRIEIVLEGPGA